MCIPREIIPGLRFSILMSQQQNIKHLQITPAATATKLDYGQDSLKTRDIPPEVKQMSWRAGEETMSDGDQKKSNLFEQIPGVHN